MNLCSMEEQIIIVLGGHIKGWICHMHSKQTNHVQRRIWHWSNKGSKALWKRNQTKYTIFYSRSIKVQKECSFDGPIQNIIDIKCHYQIYEKRETIFSLNSHKSLASLGSVANSIGLSSLQSDKYLPLTPSKSGWSAA